MVSTDIKVTFDMLSPEAVKLVRADFNPSGDPIVNEIKIVTAYLITLVQEIAKSNKEAARHAALGVTGYELAAMWAVKAATTDLVA